MEQIETADLTHLESCRLYLHAAK